MPSVIPQVGSWNTRYQTTKRAATTKTNRMGSGNIWVAMLFPIDPHLQTNRLQTESIFRTQSFKLSYNSPSEAFQDRQFLVLIQKTNSGFQHLKLS